MRQLLRRLAGIVLTLGIVLSMPGVAHASCDRAGRAAADASAGDSAHASHGTHAAHGAHVTGMPEHETTSPPAGCEGGTQAPAGQGTTCTLVAHCVTMLPAMSAEVALADAPADARRAPTDDTGPLAPALEPDSPPPRG